MPPASPRNFGAVQQANQDLQWFVQPGLNGQMVTNVKTIRDQGVPDPAKQQWRQDKPWIFSISSSLP